MSEQKLIKLDQVKAKTGRSKTAIYTDPGFPKAIKIGARSVAWVEGEIDEWVSQRIASSRGA